MPLPADTDFPANNDSLCGNDFSEKPEWREFRWKRLSEIFGAGAKVFDNIEPNDIMQGSLGDCYFLSSLSCLAEVPSRVADLFVTKTAQSTGRYEVQFFKSGKPLTVVIDDYVPVNADGQPVFSRAKGDEMWVLLMEKAWAKVMGPRGLVAVVVVVMMMMMCVCVCVYGAGGGGVLSLPLFTLSRCARVWQLCGWLDG